MLTISPFKQIYDPIYQNLLSNIPAGNFIRKAPIILPYLGKDTNTPTQFLITTDVGSMFTVFLGNQTVGTFIAVAPTTSIGIVLALGLNTITVQTNFETASISVVTTKYAVFLAGWAEQWYFNITTQVQDNQNQLLTRFGLRAVENQLAFHDLLPATRVMRILAGKLAIKSLVNLGGSTEGVNEITAAVSGTTPFVVPTTMDDQIFEPAMRPVLMEAQDFGGFEFHIWMLNLCATSWAAFVELANNLPDSVIQLISVSDEKVVVNRQGVIETHEFDFDGSGCSIIDILTNFFDCFSRVRVWISLTLESDFAFCGYSYALDTVVTNPIGARLFDTGHPFDTSSFDSEDASDPFAASLGWLGLPLTDRFDASRFLDSLSGVTFPIPTSASADSCAFDRPQAVTCTTSLLNQELDLNISESSSLIIT